MRTVFKNWTRSITNKRSIHSWMSKLSFLLILFLSVSLQLHAQHDLSIEQTVNVDSAGIGDTVTFTITLSNDSDSTATGIFVENELPTNMTHISNDGGITYSSGIGSWNVGTIIGSTSQTLQVTARLEAPGVHTSIAQVSAQNGFDVDSAPNDDIITDDDYATKCVSVPFKICTTFNDTIVLTAPTGYTMYQWSRDGTPISGATAQIYKAIQAGEYTFTADDIATGCDAGSCCPIEVEEACFDLALDKKLASGQLVNVSPGDDVTYTITVHNQGDFYADSILITDYAATGLSNNSGRWVGNDTLLTIADGALPAEGLAPATTTTVDITLSIDGNVSADSILNYAEISSAKDVSQTDNRDIDSTPDTNSGNDGGGLSSSAADNHINGNGTSATLDGNATTDEDDHDPQVVFICPNITNPSADIAVCSGNNVTALSVTTTNSDTDGIEFVYYSSQQTGTDMYDGSGTSLGTTTAAAGTASITNVSFPANITTAPVLYYVYAIINPTPDATSCRPTQEIEVTVNPNPTATIVSNPAICADENAVFTVNGTNGATLTYHTGEGNQTLLLTGVDQTITVNNATADTTLTLVSVSSSSSCTSTLGANATVTVNPNPTATIVSNPAICADENAVFTVNGTNGATLTYHTGEGNQTLLLTGVDQTITVNNATADTTLTLVSVSSSSSCTSTLGANATVTVNPNPTATIVSNPAICADENAVFTVNGTNGATLTYHTGEGNQTLLLTGVDQTITVNNATADTTLTLVSVSSSSSCTSTLGANATVTVNPNPTATIVSNPAICADENAVFTVNGTNGATLTYHTGEGNQTLLLTGVDQTITVNNATADTTLTLVSVSSSSSCTSTLGANATVTVNPNPTATIVSNPAICADENAVFTVNGTNGATLTYHTGEGNQTLLLTGVDQTITVNNATADTTLTLVSVSSSSSCTSTLGANATVTVNPNPTATIVSNPAICADENAVFTVNGTNGATLTYHTGEGNQTLLLTGVDQTITVNNATADTTLTLVSVSSSSSCTSTLGANATVTVNPNPTATIVSNPAICADENAVFTVNGTNGATLTYHTGEGNQTLLLTGVDQTITVNNATADTTLTLVSVSSSSSCTSTLGANATVTVNPNPTATIVSNPAICADENAVFTVNGTNGATLTYHTGEGNQTLLLTGVDQTITVNNATADTTLTLVSVSSSSSCTSTLGANATVTVNPNPTATLTVSDTTVCRGGMANIVISNTQVGINYQLRNDSDDSSFGIAMAGNGGDVTFSISPITATNTFNILATYASSTCEIELVDKAVITVFDCDLGDLPDASIVGSLSPDYLTTLADNGPIHYIRTDLYLGNEIDGETDATPDGMAKGDDDDATPDDEDGVLFFNSLNIVPGGTIRLPISVTNGTGSTAYLEGWIDWNGDGTLDAGERVVHEDDMTTGFPTFVEIAVPSVIADNIPIGVRFRLSLTDNMTPYGLIQSGEVEDYLISIDCATGVCIPISSTIRRGTRD